MDFSESSPIGGNHQIIEWVQVVARGQGIKSARGPGIHLDRGESESRMRKLM